MRMATSMVGCLVLFMIGCLIGSALVSSCQPAHAAPLPITATTVPTVKKAKPCKDPMIEVIRNAGWKGKQARIAYGVSWRESNHTASESTLPDLGLFQINTVWAGTKYWPANPLDAQQNANAAYRMWKDHSWRPWALNATGTGVDMRDYAWSAWQVEHWVWRPYVTGLHRYDNLPKSCKETP